VSFLLAVCFVDTCLEKHLGLFNWYWSCQYSLPKDGFGFAKLTQPTQVCGCLNVATTMLISRLLAQLFIVSCQTGAGCADVDVVTMMQVLVAGSEVTLEYRIQLYTPDYLQTNKARPVISQAAANMTYATNYTIGFTNVTNVDRVVLNRLASSTHGQRFDQRQLVLQCNPGVGSTNCATPPNSTIGPPGQYMLFILADGVPSVAEYVTLQLPSLTASAPGSAVPPTALSTSG